ncbi:hypothetical protein GUJ93_ZPchr0007g6138 [Zizania palustris]|uniref:Uncharacterized protein n=1 Tax=Zizania palustris TaxID=103762 RepID=A0A8J5STQ0_ZIZPA|nr:hypothetical protein GUJ93_ZPchr0007g6138 [Zizania palustris]
MRRPLGVEHKEAILQMAAKQKHITHTLAAAAAAVLTPVVQDATASRGRNEALQAAKNLFCSCFFGFLSCCWL